MSADPTHCGSEVLQFNYANTVLNWYAMYDQLFLGAPQWFVDLFGGIGMHSQDSSEKPVWGLWKSVYGVPLCQQTVSSYTYSDSLLSVMFTDASTNADSWYWDFGDGNTDTVQNPSYIYGVEGTYTVCLATSNACGVDTNCQTLTINCPAPVAALQATVAIDGPQVSFSDSSTGATSWLWDFGDGNTDTTQNPLHTYINGTFTVTLTVSNACGVDSVSESIQIWVGVDALSKNGHFKLYRNDVVLHQGKLVVQ